MRTTAKYLQDLLIYIARVEYAVQGGETAFLENYMIQDAVIRQYEVIGEITKRLPQELLATQPSVDWKAVKSFRDYLAHNYDRVDLVVIWDAVAKLPVLRAAVEAFIANLPPDDETTSSPDDTGRPPRTP